MHGFGIIIEDTTRLSDNLSMHINYFGDVVLFTGWALLTATIWTLGLPLLMLLMFIFMHIPPLDEYLAERYGDEFKAYQSKTKRLIPFVW